MFHMVYFIGFCSVKKRILTLTSSLLGDQVKSLKTHSKIDIMYVMEELRLRKNKCAKMVGCLIYKRGKVLLWGTPLFVQMT